MGVMTQIPVKLSYDPKAKAVAEAVYDTVRPVAVILFGSRARGDYREDSDVDLLVITADDEDGAEWRGRYVEACKAAHEKAEAVYGFPMGVDVVDMPASKFADCRRAKNHVAGQAVRDGVIVSQQPLPGEGQQPTNWPDIRTRFIAATRNENDLLVNIESGASSQEIIGFLAQQAIENALKAWISALDDEYRNIHDLADLAAIIRRHQRENDTPAGEALFWLTSYAVEYRYDGARVKIDDPHGLLERVNDLVEGIAARIRELTGSEPPRWTPLD